MYLNRTHVFIESVQPVGWFHLYSNMLGDYPHICCVVCQVCETTEGRLSSLDLVRLT